MRTAETGAAVDRQVHAALRRELLRLARLEEDIALHEAERVPYWESTPVAVAVHRRCAVALRTAADELIADDRPQVRP